MRFTSSTSIVFALVAILAVLEHSSHNGVEARRAPSRSRGPPPRRPPPSTTRKPPPRRRPLEEDEGYDDSDGEDDEEDDFDEDDPLDRFADDSDDFDDDYEEPPPRKRRPPPTSSKPKATKRPPPRKRPPPPRDYEDEYEEDDYDDYERRPPSRPSGKRKGGSSRNSRRGPPPRNGRGPPSRPGKVVPYSRDPRRRKPSAAEGAAATFTRGWTAFTSAMPDPATVREGVASSISAARETTSTLSSSIYREVKGLTSSELEQVMLKATKPDDSPVKGKHVERLVGVTYQVSARYDIYDAVLRKLWKKMAESDWRTTIKALYVLHRYSADGAPEHAQALKSRLRELRRTKDPKTKEKYFNSKQLLAGDAKPENMKYRAYMERYSRYVLLRAQCFGGVFDEISQKPVPSKRDKKKDGKAAPVMKPITSTNLRVENLDVAKMLLKNGLACTLREGEDCENTAIAAERVASDLIGLTAAVAMALNRALKGDDFNGADPALIRQWCEFYSEELMPQTRAMVKKTSTKLDPYGLFLPSRMGTTVSPDTLQKGLKAEEWAGTATVESAEEEEDDAMEEVASKDAEPAEDAKEQEEDAGEEEQEEEEQEVKKETPAEDTALDDGDEYDEYEYDEEEYYDDEE